MYFKAAIQKYHLFSPKKFPNFSGIVSGSSSYLSLESISGSEGGPSQNLAHIICSPDFLSLSMASSSTMMTGFPFILPE